MKKQCHLLPFFLFILFRETPAQAQMPSDNRIPVKLSREHAAHQLKKMRTYLEIMTNISEAFLEKRFSTIEENAEKLVVMTTPKEANSKQDRENKAFVQMGAILNQNAKKILKSAKDKQFDQLVTSYSATLRSCVDCHSTFKQDISVTRTFQAEWHVSKRGDRN